MVLQLVSDKVITIEPSRNLIKFNKFDDIDYQIINKQLVLLIVMLKLIVPVEFLDAGKTTFEIRINHLNYSMRVNTLLTNNSLLSNTKNELLITILLKSFLEARNCCYLEINGCIYRNGVYKDILSLEYDPRSFRQPDDSIREYMIKWFQSNVSREYDNILFFGGECTLLGKILSGYSKTQYFYTDYPSIYSDIKRNYKNPNLELIDYKTWKIKKNMLISRCCCLVNTGYQGMGVNLAQEICNLDATEIYVISCNQESWTKDLFILMKSYDLLEQVEIRTNYSIWIYKLIRQ
jgi:hypothetical protein